jgi:hypothetical protein
MLLLPLVWLQRWFWLQLGVRTSVASNGLTSGRVHGWTVSSKTQTFDTLLTLKSWAKTHSLSQFNKPPCFGPTASTSWISRVNSVLTENRVQNLGCSYQKTNAHSQSYDRIDPVKDLSRARRYGRPFKYLQKAHAYACMRSFQWPWSSDQAIVAYIAESVFETWALVISLLLYF